MSNLKCHSKFKSTLRGILRRSGVTRNSAVSDLDLHCLLISLKMDVRLSQ